MDGACKERWYEGKNDGYKSMGVFLSILTLYPCNQLWVFRGLFINYQAQVSVKYNSPYIYLYNKHVYEV